MRIVDIDFHIEQFHRLVGILGHMALALAPDIDHNRLRHSHLADIDLDYHIDHIHDHLANILDHMILVPDIGYIVLRKAEQRVHVLDIDRHTEHFLELADTALDRILLVHIVLHKAEQRAHVVDIEHHTDHFLELADTDFVEHHIGCSCCCFAAISTEAAPAPRKKSVWGQIANQASQHVKGIGRNAAQQLTAAGHNVVQQGMMAGQNVVQQGMMAGQNVVQNKLQPYVQPQQQMGGYPNQGQYPQSNNSYNRYGAQQNQYPQAQGNDQYGVQYQQHEPSAPPYEEQYGQEEYGQEQYPQAQENAQYGGQYQEHEPSAPPYEEQYSQYQGQESYDQGYSQGGMIMSLYYHFFNGIRHLLWDIGVGFELAQVYVSGWIVLGLTVIAGAVTFRHIASQGVWGWL